MASLFTSRLHLLPATLDHIEAEMKNQHLLAQLLNARVPDQWPPPLNDEASLQWTLRYLREIPDVSGWAMWYFILRDTPDGKPLAIGNGGFKGKPSTDGTVEIGYSLIESHQGKGYATDAVAALIGWAFTHPMVTRVIAETLPDLTHSIRVLQKNRFRFIGPGSEQGVIRYELMREVYERDVVRRNPNLKARLHQNTLTLNRDIQESEA